MNRTCPHCRKPIPDPSLSDFERLPRRDREKLLESIAVKKGPGAQKATARAMLADFEIDDAGNLIAHRCS